MAKTRAATPRVEKAIASTDDPEYLAAFRHQLLARGLSTHTRNAYLRDLRD